jgi:cytochrome c-type biogenesis protein
VTESAPATVAAFWFGFLTSISPCLMATNVAAISFIARRADTPRIVLVSAGCYIVGQSIAFVLLGALLVSSLLTVPVVSHWLQKYMFRLLGPILVLCAIPLLDLVSFQLGDGRLKQWVQGKTGNGGYWAAALLGIVFAMSFCPTTAALFFGSLLPLAVTHESSVYLPFVYSIGVAVPVIAFSVVIALAANRIGAVFTKVGQFERYARYTTGIIFLAVGVWFTIAYTIGLV